jgi:cytochrome c oxidase subunit 1
VRGIDAYWKEKMAGNKEMTPAEPVGSIHMPSATPLPFVMSVGIFIAGLGLMFSKDKFELEFMNIIFNNYIVVIIGLLITFGAMALRSLYDDHGWHIEPEDQDEKGART